MIRHLLGTAIIIVIGTVKSFGQSPLPPIPDPPAESSSDTRPSAVSNLDRASEAFAAKRYTQAAALFLNAKNGNEVLSPTHRDEWAYCLLHAVASRFNSSSYDISQVDRDSAEVEQAARLGSERVAPFASQLRGELAKRKPKSAGREIESGWQVVEGANFRIYHRNHTSLAGDVGRTAEAARQAMFERWHGPAPAAWSPKCDIYLHRAASEYARQTNKSADAHGHSTVNVQDGAVMSRRIDLNAEATNLLDSAVPVEVTYVVLSGIFSNDPLPRWAIVGMCGLSQTPQEVGRSRSAIADLYRQRKLFVVGPFLERADFTEDDSMTAFVAESVSLVAFLVEQRGAKAFTTFLREAPRRGYAKSLATHYGFKDATDLQGKWLRNSLAAD